MSTSTQTYRCRPTEVTAKRYTRWRRRPKGATVWSTYDGLSTWIDLQGDGSMYEISIGSWLITWPDGRRSICTDAEFKARFESVEVGP